MNPFFKDVSLFEDRINFDFKNKNNKIEEFNLFQKLFSKVLKKNSYN